jgi:hypothetical protein
MTNPLYDRRTESTRTTINGIPVHRLFGKLPPPATCPECLYPVWELDDPDARQVARDEFGDEQETRTHILGRMEWARSCYVSVDGRTVINLACKHPYHLIEHRCRADRPEPVFPADLINWALPGYGGRA